MDNKWYKDLSFSSIGDSNHGYSWNWITQAIAVNGFRTGKIIYDFQNQGIGDLQQITKQLKQLGGRIFCRTDGKTKIVSLHIIFDSGMAYITDSEGTKLIYAGIQCTDSDLFESVKKLLTDSLKPMTSDGSFIYVLSYGQGGNIVLENLGATNIPIEWDNYTKEVGNNVKHIIKDFQVKSPCGRLALFSGSPGTGKTYLLRGILSETKNAIFILIPPKLVGELSGPNFIQALIRIQQGNCPIIFVIEDADECLVQRSGSNMSEISAMLNLSDGILGLNLDLRIMATTNAFIKDIDKAIERKGRLCKFVDVKPLELDHADQIYRRLLNDSTAILPSRGGPYTLADIYYEVKFSDNGDPKVKSASSGVGFKLSLNPQQAIPAPSL